MTGNFIDHIYYKNTLKQKNSHEHMYFLETDFGKIRMLDTGGNKPVIINVPDGPNVIEHQLELVKELSKNYRIICFEYPGIGFSYPNAKYNYSFDDGTQLLIQIMQLLKLETVSLLFSCSNSFYALNAAMNFPDRFNYIFISQSACIDSMVDWTKRSIPKLLKIPIIGQLSNILLDKKLANIWYQYSLPKVSDKKEIFRKKANSSLQRGGCFCLSSLVQSLKKERNTSLFVEDAKVTLVWGSKDFTHRKTNKDSIQKHVKSCEIIEFENCGHFPELEDHKSYAKLISERLG